ncbi:putative PKS-like enzyme [Aspergillus melleus]|uniref:putative PKS-like enzyme n=1 Tax=Aspergillus melleus TaxID=138277 RepID=UPI001E8D0D31|nr:uncharacterized protein LDX57_002046 [Aspergillus melleus]KAH8424293.1 hypothetical protein LDX57_002046 [Aspergillus melleus]
MIAVESLADLNDPLIDNFEIVLSLTELGYPVIEQLGTATFEKLQLLLERSKRILWVKQAVKALIKMARLDLVRLVWNVEPELAAEQGKVFIPRLPPDKKRNDRINALKRKVETQPLVGAQPVTLVRSLHNANEIVYWAEEGLLRHPNLVEFPTGSELISLRVECCSVEPTLPNYHEKDLFCCVGRTQEGRRLMALSDSNSSIITVPRMLAIQLDGEDVDDAMDLSVLITLLNDVRARVVERSMPSGYTTLLYGSGGPLMAALNRRKCIASKSFAFIDYQTESSCASRSSNHIKLSVIKHVLPTNAAVVSFSDLDTDGLDPHEVLLEALAHVKSLPSSPVGELESASVVKASALVTDGNKNHAITSVVDWTGDQAIIIGQPMCRWMVVNGARHIVVTSRNPDKEALWNDELQKQGANIAIKAADVTNKQQLVELRARILENMPPICAVANDAIVLSNSLFADKSYDSFQKTLKPKADSSMNLDEVFLNDDLDFFILFSSISAVTGRQSPTMLLQTTHARNLAASVTDIGKVIGIDVIQKTADGEETSAMETTLRKLDYMPASERDLHHLLAEAILVGSSDESPEIVTGLEINSENNAFWHKNLRFPHLLTRAGSSLKVRGSGNNVQKAWKEKVAEARGRDDALQITEEAILTCLVSSLKVGSASGVENALVVADSNG